MFYTHNDSLESSNTFSIVVGHPTGPSRTRSMGQPRAYAGMDPRQEEITGVSAGRSAWQHTRYASISG
jgi:hypothetical protein